MSPVEPSPLPGARAGATAWVEEATGVRLLAGGGAPGGGAGEPGRLGDLVGLALRRNPQRAHLLVSTVLGKHVPVDPRTVLGAGRALGAAVREVLGDQAGDALVLGYAETATALGHAVAQELGARYVHSTRRRPPGADLPGALAFEEEHSHATAHLLLPEDPGLLERDGPLVLVDDELSTGRTVLNTLASLTAPTSSGAPSGRDRRCVVAALVDVRSPADRAAGAEAARALGIRLDVVALATGTVEVPDGTPARVAALLAEHDGALGADGDGGPGSDGGPSTGDDPVADPSRRHRADVVDLGAAGWPDGVREGGRHGFGPADAAALDAAVEVVAARVADHLAVPARAGHVPLAPGTRVLVLGCEELMWAPQRLAAALAGAVPPGVAVLTSSTTRSPVLVLDDPGYPVRTALSFAGEGGGPRFAYNVAPGRGGAVFEEVVLVLDDGADPGGAVDALARACGRLGVITLPAHRPGGAGR